MSKLGNVRRGRIVEALRVVLYGPGGVGKTHLASDSENPIFLDVEGGSDQFDVPRYMFRDEDGGHVPQTYGDVLDAIADLRDNDHDFKTLIIDTLDQLEPLIWAHMIARDSGKPSPRNEKARELNSIEDYAWGKGPHYALDEWRKFVKLLDELRSKRRMQIILVAHATVKPFSNPEGEDYDRYRIRLLETKQVFTAGFLTEWADVVGFCRYEEGGAKGLSDKKAKGFSTGRRLIHTQRAAAFDAKTRLALPPEIELAEDHPWAPFAEAIDRARGASPDDLRKLIDVELERIGDPDLAANVATAVRRAGNNIGELNKYLHNLRSRAAVKSEEQAA